MSSGIRWPAEWERHQGTWMSWPHNRGTWPDDVELLEHAFVQAIAALAAGEVLHLNVVDESVEARARARLLRAGVPVLSGPGSRSGVRLQRIRTNDAWCRDYGPVFTQHTSAGGTEQSCVDFRFNAWGGKYPPWSDDDAAAGAMAAAVAVRAERSAWVLEGGAIEGNGAGLIMTTEECLLNPSRNGQVSKAAMQQLLADTLGCRELIWLGGGVVGDDTDGHIDNLARFVSADTVVCLVEPDRHDVNHAPLQDNLQRLRAWRSAGGEQLRVIELPAPDALEHEDRRLPASYANFYIGNDVVLLPVYGGSRDAEAIRIVSSLLPERRVVPIDSRVVVRGFGAWHCLTQQVPDAVAAARVTMLA